MSLLMLPRPDSNTDQELSAQLDDPDCVSREGARLGEKVS